MTNDITSLLSGFWRDLQQPDLLWQVAVLALCLTLAFFADRLMRDRRPQAEGAWRIGQRGLQRITFPLVGMLLVMLARQLLQHLLHVHLLSLAVPMLGSLAVIRSVFYVLRFTFRYSGWLVTFERVFAMLVWGGVALYIVGLLPDLIEILEGIGFSVGRQQLNLWLLLQGVATVLTTVLVALWLGGLVETRLMDAEGLDANLRVVFARLTRAMLMLLAVLIGLPLVGIDLTTLSVFSGALGVGLGFGLQKIASSYVSGFIILLDRSIRIGNVIAIGNERGQVTQITTRYTVLKNLTGVEAIVPNEVLIGSVVLNESLSDPRMRIALPVQIGYESDVENAMRIMCDAALAQPRVLADPPARAYLTAFGESGINLELGFWIADPQEGTLQLRSDINMAIWREFQAVGINIPYPQRDLRIVAGNAG
jgi:small-conductance mechanosensitive channel